MKQLAVVFLMGLFLLGVGTASAYEIPDGGPIAWDNAYYTTWVWDQRGEDPIPLEAENILQCLAAWTFIREPLDWHYQYIHEEMDAFKINWYGHGGDAGYSEDIYFKVYECYIYDTVEEEYVWIGESMFHRYETHPNMDSDANCLMGLTDLANINACWQETPIPPECVSSDYDRSGVVGLVDKAVVQILWQHKLCEDNRWISGTSQCELLPFWLWTDRDFSSSPPVPVDDYPPDCP